MKCRLMTAFRPTHHHVMVQVTTEDNVSSIRQCSSIFPCNIIEFLEQYDHYAVDVEILRRWTTGGRSYTIVEDYE
jgi:hypothetical protein